MNIDTYVDYLMHLLRCVLKDDIPSDFPQELDFNEFFKLSRDHRLENIAYVMLKQTNMSGISKQDAQKLENAYMQSMMITATQQHYLEQVEKAFEENSIDYLVLKGRELSRLYLSPDMRQSSDFDIYIGVENSEKAKGIMRNIGFAVKEYSEDENHDEYVIGKWVLCELHRVLIQGNYPWKKGCNKIVDNLTLCDGTKHCYKMSKEDFYVYNIAHAAKHMKFSGIGIKVFLDIEVIYLKYKDSFDYEYLNAKLEACHLKEFEKNARLLCEYWFEGNNNVSVTIKKMASYVVSSGWIGTVEQMLATDVAERSGKTNSKLVAKIKKCISIVLSPYETMVERYPILRKHKWLTPLYRVRRAISAIVKKRSLIKSVTNTIDETDMDVGKRILEFKKSIGL